MKYSEYLTKLLEIAHRNHALHEPLYLCNQLHELRSAHPEDTQLASKFRLFITRLLNRQERETGRHTTTLSQSAHKHFGVDYTYGYLTQNQQNEYRLHVLQKYLDLVIHLEKLASSRKKSK